MMMMMMLLNFAVVILLAVVPVVQADNTEFCKLLSGDAEKCEASTRCFVTIEQTQQCRTQIGKGSVARQGVDNMAPGIFSTTGGGQRNLAGAPEDVYNVVGGGYWNECVGNKNTISGGNRNLAAGLGGAKLNTISGGLYNYIEGDSTSSAVITGGGGASSSNGNKIIGSNKSTISGGTRNRVTGSGGTVTGGVSNGVSNGFDANSFGPDTGANIVMTGGEVNNAVGQGSVVVGGAYNFAEGDYSIALGESARAKKGHSMAVNLMNTNGEVLSTEQNGHFVMSAESFRLQIGNGKDKNGAIQFTKMNYDNIDNLATALAE